jgi:hypothetical protein
MACPFFNRGCASNSEKVTSIVEFYSTHARKASRRHSCRQFDQKCADPYNGGFTVKHFFDLMNCSSSPAGTRWAALFYGACFGAPTLPT